MWVPSRSGRPECSGPGRPAARSTYDVGQGSESRGWTAIPSGDRLGHRDRASRPDQQASSEWETHMGSRTDSSTGRVRRWPVVLVGLAVALASAACTSDDEAPADEAAPVVQLGAPGEAGETLSPDEAEAIDEPTWTDADVEFVQMMIPHHQQALEMTALVEDRAGDPDLAQLAERIEVSQQDEIALLEKWRSRRGEMVSGMHGGHGDHGGAGGHPDMPGMLTPAQLDQLARSKGERFDRLFLEGMIRHHEGAVVMVETLLTGGEGGQESEIFQLASHIGTDQQVEIAAMKERLGS